MAALPTNVAFDVFIRAAGQEFKLSSLALAAGRATQYGLGAATTCRPFTSCDIILRSSTKVAAETTDLCEIWDGELVYPNIAVQLSTSAAAASQATPTTQPTP